MKTPAHYKAKPNDIDRSLLTVIPEAPRVPQQGLPPGYDWNMLSDDAMFANPNVREYAVQRKCFLLLISVLMFLLHRIITSKRVNRITKVTLS